MGTEVTTPFGQSVQMADVKEMARRAQAAGDDASTGSAPEGCEYMNFSGKRGMYTIGSGESKGNVDADELWLLNAQSLEAGYICWKGGRPAGKRVVSIYGDSYPVAQPSDDEGGPFNTDKGDGWFAARAWVCKSLDTGRQAYFANNSVSGVGEMAEIYKEVARRMGSGQAYWPLFHFDMEAFESQGFKNYKPTFKVYGWLNDDAVMVLGENPEADIDDLITASAEVTAIAKSPDKGKEDSADPEPVEQKKPAGRRRRRA